MKRNQVDLAVKVMDQSFIRKENKTAFVLTERKVMSRLLHPNIVRFYCSFRVRLCLPGGKLQPVVARVNRDLLLGRCSRTTKACTW
jgi:serine/threonine protein kinase